MYHFFKRIFDFSATLLGLVIILPLFIIIAILVWINHGLPVIFRQERVGKNEKIFIMYKFRTMTNENDQYGNLLPDNKRITKFGSFIRKTSLDELPELINVLKGDMSLVGPRPLLPRYLPYYTSRERLRHKVRPGITGLAQVNGRNILNWDERLELDVQYVENLSFISDLKIFFKTFIIIFKPSKNVGLNIIDDYDVYKKNLINDKTQND